ncbi:I78 family peptidase inhibitor [Pseudomonas sp. PSKL.D1]|uniref:I78 family peptidase inhibitor n=1 Tax=Pseudomonas sp. PSKL.D1 TaxID=3029060 RepID=UPI0023815EBB|nr:I78 family peptidase inhibitor [Pseudomonas sp. PSKL.D1]WDY57964.1 I78 family peptidase inhibitor [Pseudomonas sp. PSKL.D1]
MDQDVFIKKIAHLIGTPYEDAIKAKISQATGIAVVAGPKDIITRDIRNDRAIVSVDGKGVITAIRIG